MKETVITIRRKKIELVTFLICIAVALGLNVYAIVRYDTPWSELYTELLWVVVWGCGIYVLWSLGRLAFWGVYRLFRKRPGTVGRI